LVNGSLAAGSAVTVQGSGTLGGTGTVGGVVTNQAGGMLLPGSSGIGKLTFSSSVSLLDGSTNLFEISKNGGVLTNDLAAISGALKQGGSLMVTNIGTNALAAGDSFKLFNAASFSGAFTNIVLPPLASGLNWNTTTLASNGTLAVVWNTYTLTYLAGANGTISGTSTQTVNYGASGTAVTAVPDTDFYFSGWSDGLTANPRTDAGVTNNLSVTANFLSVEPARPVILSGLTVASGGNFLFQFTGTVGLHYRVETTPVLPATGAWQVVTDIISLAASPFAVSQPLTNSQGFYRIGFLP
jgi:hypothetical protein